MIVRDKLNLQRWSSVTSSICSNDFRDKTFCRDDRAWQENLQGWSCVTRHFAAMIVSDKRISSGDRPRQTQFVAMIVRVKRFCSNDCPWQAQFAAMIVRDKRWKASYYLSTTSWSDFFNFEQFLNRFFEGNETNIKKADKSWDSWRTTYILDRSWSNRPKM